MSWSEILVIVLIVLALAVLAAWAGAHRVDRLYRRAEATRAALQTQLLRRSAVALELASSGLVNPAAAIVLSQCALTAQEAGDAPPAGGGAWWRADPRAESELSLALREALGDEVDVAEAAAGYPGDQLLPVLASVWYRVQVARRFYNDAVADAEYLSHQPVIRAFRLDGRRARPQAFDMDDEMPAGLEGLVRLANV